MCRKFLLMLLVFSAVLTASGSASALTAYDFSLIEEPILYTDIEGYNYRTKVIALSGDENISSQVTWVMVCNDWFTSSVASDDSLIIEGKLPPYNSSDIDANKYIINAEAYTFGEVESTDASGDIVYDESGDVIWIPDVISASLDIEVNVTQFNSSDNWLGTFNDFITYSPDEYTSADYRYSVVLTFKTSYDLVPDYLYVLNEDGSYSVSYDEMGYDVLKSNNKVEGTRHVLMQFPYGTSLDIAYFGENLNLPSWLSYDVLSTQVAELFDEYTNTRTSTSYDIYVKELRIFYKADKEPENITAPVTGSVRIENGVFDYDYIIKKAPDSASLTPVIGWGLTFVNSIALSEQNAEVYADMSKSGTLTLNYLYQRPVSWDFSPKDEASNFGRFNIRISSNDRALLPVPNGGTIIMTVSPDINTSGDYVYSGDFTVFDSTGKAASTKITLHAVLPKLVFTEENITVSAEIGKTSSFTLHALSGDGYDNKIVSWSVPQDTDGITFSGFKQSGNVITVSFDALAEEGTYTKVIEFKNAFEHSASVNVKVNAFASGDISIAVDPKGSSTKIISGLSSDITLNAGNVFGTLSWAVVNNTIPAGFRLSLKSVLENSAVFTVTAPNNAPNGTYSADITLTDVSGRTATYNLKWTVTNIPPIEISGDKSVVIDVIYGESGDAVLTCVNTLPVKWFTSKDISSDVSLNVSWDSESDTSGKITVVAEPLKALSASYKTELYFIDYQDNKASVDLTVNVTLPELTVSPDKKASLDSGLSSDITLTADNVFGTLTWKIAEDTVPEGFTLTLNRTYGNSAVFRVTAPNNVKSGTYSADITLTESITGRVITYNVKWTVNNVPAIMISGDKSALLNITYGDSAEAVFTFVNAKPVHWSMTEDISDDVKISVSWTDLTDGSGEITVTAEPVTVKNAAYSTALYFTDYQSNDVSIDLSISVTLPEIVLSPDRRVVLISPVGSTNTESVNYYNAQPKSCKLSPDNAPSAFNLTITSDDSKLTFAIAPYAAAYRHDYDGTVIITDIYGNTKTLEISLAASLPEDTLTVAPKEQSISLSAGETKTVPLEAANNHGLVRWIIGTVPSNLTVTRTSAPSQRDNDISPVFSVTASEVASGDYSVRITASDDFTRTDAVLTVRVTKHVEPVIDTVIQTLIDNGFVSSDGRTLTQEAFDSGSDTAFISETDYYIRVIVLRFAVSKWNIYLNGGNVPTATSGVNSSAGELVTVTPDADKKSALISIAKSSLQDNTAYDVTMGVIPEGSSQEITSSLGIVSGRNTLGVEMASGGCETGLGALIPVLIAAFFAVKKRS